MKWNKRNRLFILALLFIYNPCIASINWRGTSSGDDWIWGLIGLIIIIPLPTALLFCYLSVRKNSQALNILASVFTGILWLYGVGLPHGGYTIICAGAAALCIGMLLSTPAKRYTSKKFIGWTILIIILYLFAARAIVHGFLSLIEIGRYSFANRYFDWALDIIYFLFHVYLLYRFIQQMKLQNMRPITTLRVLGLGFATGFGASIISILFITYGFRPAWYSFAYHLPLIYKDISIGLAAGLVVYALNKRNEDSILKHTP